MQDILQGWKTWGHSTETDKEMQIGGLVQYLVKFVNCHSAQTHGNTWQMLHNQVKVQCKLYSDYPQFWCLCNNAPQGIKHK